MTMETFDASATWTCPAGVTSVQVEGYGAGGGPLNPGYKDPNAYGAGGGAYSKLNAFVSTPGNNYSISIGAAGVAGNGGDTTFNSTSMVAKGGTGGAWSAGVGGAAASGTGDVKYSGGNGGTPDAVYGGGGGSSAGTGSNGNNGANGSAGGAGGSAPTGGYAGGNGANAAPGGNGTAPGGGGGGAGYGSDSGDGGKGRVILTYTASSSGIPLTFQQNLLVGGFSELTGGFQ